MSYLRRDLLITALILGPFVAYCCYGLFTLFEGGRLILALVGITLVVLLGLPGVILHALMCDNVTGIEGYLALHHPEHLTARGRWYRRAYFIWVWSFFSLIIFSGCLTALLGGGRGDQ